MYNVTCTIHVFIAIVMPLNKLNQSHALTVPDMLFITISLTLLCRVSGREDGRILRDMNARKCMSWYDHGMIRSIALYLFNEGQIPHGPLHAKREKIYHLLG
jgi:hypothetical protein